MPTWKRCDNSVNEMASAIMLKYPEHKPLVDAHVTIDYLFASAPVDSEGEPTGDALTHGGYRATGIASINNSKNRCGGRADAEIAIDHDWWVNADEEERAALLDHELMHITTKLNKAEKVDVDEHNRPVLKMRKHDVQIGWFAKIAERHGGNSIEVQQANEVWEVAGQYYWPAIYAKTK